MPTDASGFGTTPPPRALLVSTYDLGHQPLGLATTARWLTERGFDVELKDLAVEELNVESVKSAAVIGLHLPMHTATRLAAAVIPKLRKLNPDAFLTCFGLYSDLNSELLIGLGVDLTISGEFAARLVDECANAVNSGSRPEQANLRVLEREPTVLPLRDPLPKLDRYVKLRIGDDVEKMVGHTETTRGCRHMCRHCPIVPVYQGRFFALDRAVVINDVDALVEAGAEHISFGDADFLNGPVHARRIVSDIHHRHPNITWDCTIKVEHLAKHCELLPEFASAGCVLITSAVESFDDDVLVALDKRHTTDEFELALHALRAAEIALNPTFVAFTPMTSLDSYWNFLGTIGRLGLVDSVAPIQYAIRLLVTNQSLLLTIPEIAAAIGPYDAERLVYPWSHPDPRMDRLQRTIEDLVASASSGEKALDRLAMFEAIRAETALARGSLQSDPMQIKTQQVNSRKPIPYLTEPWYC